MQRNVLNRLSTAGARRVSASGCASRNTGTALVIARQVLTAALVAGALLAAPGVASAAIRLGGVDVNQACKQQYGNPAKAVLLANNAYGWKCSGPRMTCSSLGGRCTVEYRIYGGIDMNRACKARYGSKAYAVLEQNHAQGWKCFK